MPQTNQTGFIPISSPTTIQIHSPNAYHPRAILPNDSGMGIGGGGGGGGGENEKLLTPRILTPVSSAEPENVASSNQYVELFIV